MKPSELYEALHALISERVPMHVWGAAGVGKSQIVRQVARDLYWHFIDVRAVQLDPVDLRGLPRVSGNQTEWVPPKFLPGSGQGILFLDELTSAPQMTQAASYQLVLDRKLGEYELPEGWVVIAAGNPASERGVHFAMPRPLRNRFVHLDLEPDFDDWCRWAVKARIRPEIIAFLRFKRELLHDAKVTSDANAWPTPRYWEMASNVLNGFSRLQPNAISEASEIEAKLLEGTVGQGAALELVAFLRLFRQLPSIDEILLNPDGAPLPAEPSAQIAIATALGRVLTDNSIVKGMTYLNRMPAELREAYLKLSPHPGQLATFVNKCAARMLQFKDWRDEDLKSIQAPVMIMIGDADVIRPEHAVEMYRLIPGSQLAIFPGTNHMDIVNRADLLLATIPRFLDASIPDSK